MNTEHTKIHTHTVLAQTSPYPLIVSFMYEWYFKFLLHPILKYYWKTNWLHIMLVFGLGEDKV